MKEKNLLIGKLRHEAVTLNEHLTKALRILKKGRPEDNVDRQIITNYFLHFLAIDRSDPKKFEALQLISALLGWTDGMFSFSPSHSQFTNLIQSNVSRQVSHVLVHRRVPLACEFHYRRFDVHLARRRSIAPLILCSWPAVRAIKSR